jgi:hypothetical protein
VNFLVTETYTALEQCARRRLSSEWRCSEAERELLDEIPPRPRMLVRAAWQVMLPEDWSDYVI